MFYRIKSEMARMIAERIETRAITYSQVLEMLNKHKNYICETCGCFIAPGFVVAGVKEVRQREACRSIYPYYPTEDYVYTPYYCKVHAPNTENEK